MIHFDLPRATRQDFEQQQVFFSVDLARDGTIFVDGQQVRSASEISPRARAALARNPELRAVIRADQSLPHGTVIEIIDLLKQEGITKIAFAVSPKNP